MRLDYLPASAACQNFPVTPISQIVFENIGFTFSSRTIVTKMAGLGSTLR